MRSVLETNVKWDKCTVREVCKTRDKPTVS